MIFKRKTFFLALAAFVFWALSILCTALSFRQDGSSVTVAQASSGAMTLQVSPARSVAPVAVVVTNFVETVVTNVVTVTNVVVLKKPEITPSLRKTEPYLVSSDALGTERLVQLLSKAGARVIRAYPASQALVEANAKSIDAMRAEAALYCVRQLDPEAKISGVMHAGNNAAAPESSTEELDLDIWPLSSIDVGQIVVTVNRLGGQAKAEIVAGRAVVRARLAAGKVRELSCRGDVLKIERSGR